MITIYVPKRVVRSFTAEGALVTLPDRVFGFMPAYKTKEDLEADFPDAEIMEFDIQEEVK